MSRNTFFVQNCGTCGRPLKIRVHDLGKEVCCQHCKARFLARDCENESAAMQDAVSLWIGIADEILADREATTLEPLPRTPK